MNAENKPHGKTGPKPMDQGERKIAISFSVKRKHAKTAKKEIQILVDKINKN